MFKDYDCILYYHPGKANVVADALTRKERLMIIVSQEEIIREFEALGLDVNFLAGRVESRNSIEVRPTIIGRIRELQELDEECIKMKRKI